jgi:hypothetical protein
MARGTGARAKKVKIGISLDAELYEWLLARTGSGREFASISHAVARSVAQYQARAPAVAPAPLPPRDEPQRRL